MITRQCLEAGRRSTFRHPPYSPLSLSSKPSTRFLFMSAPATITVEFTGEPVICHNCPTERAKDHLGPEGWRKVRSATTRKLEDVCSRCYTYLKDKSGVSPGSFLVTRAEHFIRSTPSNLEGFDIVKDNSGPLGA